MISKTGQAHLSDRIQDVLRFDRLYARRLRDLAKAARVNEANVAELGIFQELLPGPCTPGWLIWRLDLDPGYLSRSLRQLELMGFISACGCGDDRRQRQVTLTDRGRVVARSLERFREDAARQRLEELPLRQQRRLVRAMNAIIEILERDALANLPGSGR